MSYFHCTAVELRSASLALDLWLMLVQLDLCLDLVATHLSKLCMCELVLWLMSVYVLLVVSVCMLWMVCCG